MYICICVLQLLLLLLLLFLFLFLLFLFLIVVVEFYRFFKIFFEAQVREVVPSRKLCYGRSLAKTRIKNQFVAACLQM